MIRLYEYEPHIDNEGNTVNGYRDFQNYLFSHPYGFIWDFPNDKVTIYGVAYRISSLQRIPDNNQVTCLCLCDGGGNGSGGNGIAKIVTDVSLHGEGRDADPLGVQLSSKSGNRLVILDDGCYVGSEPLPYTPPTLRLSSNIPVDEYLSGQSLDNMILTVTVNVGSASIRDLRINYDENKTLHVFDLASGTYTYTFPLTTGVDRDITFKASCNDGMDYYSNSLQYKFVLPFFVGISDTINVNVSEIMAGTQLKVSGSSFDHVYEKFKKQHLWMACPENRIIKSITDENGFSVTTAFKKTAVKLTLADEEHNYTLYVFDTKTTGENYKITFNS